MLNSLQSEWKMIQDYEGLYWVSTEGKIKNPQGKILKIYKNNRGYHCIKLYKNKKAKSFLLHRLVAIAFIPAELNKSQVNHIDGNKDNNKASNLEWCSDLENKSHALSLGLFDKIYQTKNTLGKKHKRNPSSKYHNVTYDKSRDEWIACIRHNKKTLYQRRFDREEAAALHVNWIIDTLGLTNRPKNIVKDKCQTTIP